MADFTVISDSALDPDAPLTSELAYAWRDNLIAVTEGASGAPRISLSAIERLSPGEQIRSRIDAEKSDSTEVFGHAFDFMQKGTIRCSFEHRVSSSVITAFCVVNRIRNGVVTEVASFPQTDSYVLSSVDVGVEPGDRVEIISKAVSGVDAYIRNCRFKTNGQNLWPGNSVLLEGNVFL